MLKVFSGLLSKDSKKAESDKSDESPVPKKRSDLAESVFGFSSTVTASESRPENQGTTAIYEKTVEMQTAAVELCRMLNVPSTTFNSEKMAESWIEKLVTYQKEDSFRLSYFCVSQYIFENSIDGKESGFLTNIDSVIELAQKKYCEDAENQLRPYKMALKFQDHVNLAIQQKRLVNQTRSEMVKEIKGLVSPSIDEMTKDMTSQLVGMVALFTALSFIVFGGISSMDSIMKALQATTQNKGSILPTLIVAIGWAFCMLNLLFAFMYFVIRITRLPKPIDGDARNVVQRYPIVFLANYILLVLFLVFGACWFAECNGIGKSFFAFVLLHESMTFLIGLSIIILIAIVLGFFLWRMFAKKRN